MEVVLDTNSLEIKIVLMELFVRQKKFVRDFENELFNAFQDVVTQFGFVIKDFVVNKQLFQRGIDGRGERLPGYKRTTIRIKRSKGQPVDRTTLHDEEEFVTSIQIDPHPDRLEVTSNVSYDKYIIKRYGSDVLVPTKENMEEFFRVYLMPKLKENVRNQIAR